MDLLLSDRTADGVVTLTFNRPEKKNALNLVLAEALRATLRTLSEDDDVRVLVLTGAGGEFCSGADLTEPPNPPRHPLNFMRTTADLALALHRFPRPVVAKVAGVAAGAGCSLALGCDLIVAGESARFSLIFAKRGLSLDYGSSWLLPRLVGLHRAKEMALLGDLWSAADAAGIGLVNRVVADDVLDAEVDALAGRLAQGPPLALSMTKSMLNQAFAMGFEEAAEHEARAQAVNFASDDTKESVLAFIQKREPTYRGW